VAGEAPQFHQPASEGQSQGPRTEREGEEHRRGRRNRGGRDRDRNRGERPRDEHSSVTASLAEQQRRIHELESRAEQGRHEEAQPPQQHSEPPAPVEPPREEPRRVEQPPRVEEPRIDAKQLLNDSGLVMIETDRAKATVQPQVVDEAQPLGRPRRERPKPASQDDELVQIETNRK